MFTTLKKLDPTDFQHMLGLSDDLIMFYNLYDDYLNDKTQRKRFALEKKWEELFFTIKHRELEGAITNNTAHELRLHLDELLDERGS